MYVHVVYIFFISVCAYIYNYMAGLRQWDRVVERRSQQVSQRSMHIGSSFNLMLLSVQRLYVVVVVCVVAAAAERQPFSVHKSCSVAPSLCQSVRMS